MWPRGGPGAAQVWPSPQEHLRSGSGAPRNGKGVWFRSGLGAAKAWFRSGSGVTRNDTKVWPRGGPGVAQEYHRSGSGVAQEWPRSCAEWPRSAPGVAQE